MSINQVMVKSRRMKCDDENETAKGDNHSSFITATPQLIMSSFSSEKNSFFINMGYSHFFSFIHSLIDSLFLPREHIS